LNPKILIPAKNFLSGISNIFLVEPVNYQEFVYLMIKAYIIVSDSGGIQEEASSLGKPLLVTRNNTERPEGLKTGTTKLVGTNKKNIIKNIEHLLRNKKCYQKMSKAQNPYGDGQASKKIINYLKFIK
jgi:UDP-N-acetylglucosamine 2-epimerase (non-hydrolysing)